MEESVKAREGKRNNRLLFIAVATLGLLIYTAGVCASAIYVDRRALARQAGNELSWEEDDDTLPAAAGGGMLELGQKITAQGECEFTVVDCSFSREAFAPNATEDSPGYVAGSEAQGYVDLAVKYKNLNGAAADIDGIASPVLTCANGDTYGAFAVIESPGGSQFVEYAEIAPRRGELLHYLFLVPKDVGEGAFWIEFTIAGQEYTIGFAEGFAE